MAGDRTRHITAIVLAGLVAAGVYAVLAAAAARMLVAGVQRQAQGAVLFGAVALALVPVAAAVWLLAWRVCRKLVRVEG